MANFCTLVDENASPNHRHVKALPKSSWCEDFSDASILWNGKVLVTVKACKKCAYIYLGRVSSYFSFF